MSDGASTIVSLAPNGRHSRNRTRYASDLTQAKPRTGGANIMGPIKWLFRRVLLYGYGCSL